MKLRIVKAMCFGGARHEPGAELDVAEALARELLAQGRATRADAAAAAQQGPMTTDTAGALVEPPKGAKHAGK